MATEDVTTSDKTEEKRRPLLRPSAKQLQEERAELLMWAASFAKAGQTEAEQHLLNAAESLRDAEKATAPAAQE